MNWYRKEMRRMSSIYKQALPTGFINCKSCGREFIVDFDPKSPEGTQQSYHNTRKLENNPHKNFDPVKHIEHGSGVFRCAFCGQAFNSEYDFHPVSNPSDPLEVDYSPISSDEFGSLKSGGFPEFVSLQ